MFKMFRKKFYSRASVAVIAALVVIVGFALTPVLGQTSSIITLGSTTDTVVRGYFAADVPPVLRIKSGQTVAIDTISLGGIPANESPIDFFGRYGIPPEDVLPEAVDIHFNEERPGLGPHLVTGPIYIEDAAPGDMLEVRVLDVKLRTPYGRNSSNPGGGVLTDLLTEPFLKIIPLDYARNVGLFLRGYQRPTGTIYGNYSGCPTSGTGQG